MLRATGAGEAALRLASVAAVALLTATSALAFDSGSTRREGRGDVMSIISRALATAGTEGPQTVDPLSLNPPALIEYEPWFHAIPYDKCWKGASEITCVAYLRTFQVGDGSLEGAGGLPVDWGIVCDEGYSLFQEFKNTWAIVRLYTLNGDIVSRYRLEIGEGTVYNSVTGKAAKMWYDDLFASAWSPPGALETETITIYGNDWSAATMGGRPLLLSHGVATIFPDGTWQQKGAHPLDAYFFGDPSGIAPVCAYVK
jgi:hypothetical protein